VRLFRFTALAFGGAVLFAAGLSAAPAITGVYNAASWLPPDLPNSGVAQGAILTVTGTGLGPTTLVEAFTYPLPTTQGIGGTTMQVKVGGVTETCIMIYSLDTQVAAILPSATPVGNGTLTLTFEGASTSFAIQVQTADFGTFTLNEGGTGPGVFTDGSGNAITMINPANPGETVVAWGTGLGAVSGNETEPPVEVNLNTGVQVLVQNQQATVVYGGRSSSPGLDQIDFVIPPGISGCKISVAVTVKGVTGNITTISVAPAGQATCGDTFNALTTQNLQKAIASGVLNLAGVEVSRFVGENDTLIAPFVSFDLTSLIYSYGGTFAPSVGNCLAYEVEGTTLTYTDPIQPTAFLSTGPDLVLTGPGGTKTIAASSTGFYSATLATEPSVYLAPGAYLVTNGSGGANVGPFNWGLTVPAFVVPGIPASINRSQDLTLSWTGGSPYSLVSITLFNGVAATSSLNSYVQIVCSANASTGSFTVPSAFLSLLPPGGFGTPTKAGVSIQVAGVQNASFTVPGSPGLDAGFFDVFVYNGAVATIQ
jgi:uncharacterized protein (TIGR03437 family)